MAGDHVAVAVRDDGTVLPHPENLAVEGQLLRKPVELGDLHPPGVDAEIGVLEALDQLVEVDTGEQLLELDLVEQLFELVLPLPGGDLAGQKVHAHLVEPLHPGIGDGRTESAKTSLMNRVRNRA